MSHTAPADPIFTDWRAETGCLWGAVAQRLRHRLHEHPLFSNEALAQLIDIYPRRHYSLVQWGEHGQRSAWREGEIGDLTGAQVIEAIGASRVWINLRNAPMVDPRYKTLLDEIFDELAARMPGFETVNRTMGILISSPKSRTLYHCDLPGQSLWQIRGRKRVFVYPTTAPFLRPEHVEGIALRGVEVDMPYESWYDDHAQVFDIEPGEMLHWPLNAPHRVDNFDCLNVSMTLEYFTDEIRRAHMVTRANGILRTQFGLAPRSHVTHGAGFWMKAALQKGLRNLPAVRGMDRPRKRPDFRLDPTKPGAIAEIAA